MINWSITQAPWRRIEPPERLYTYMGDRMTDPRYKGKECRGVLREGNKATWNGGTNILVDFDGVKVVVLVMRLRRKR